MVQDRSAGAHSWRLRGSLAFQEIWRQLVLTRWRQIAELVLVRGNTIFRCAWACRRILRVSKVVSVGATTLLWTDGVTLIFVRRRHGEDRRWRAATAAMFFTETTWMFWRIIEVSTLWRGVGIVGAV